jgi:hypothetical protein
MDIRHPNDFKTRLAELRDLEAEADRIRHAIRETRTALAFDLLQHGPVQVDGIKLRSHRDPRSGAPVLVVGGR